MASAPPALLLPAAADPDPDAPGAVPAPDAAEPLEPALAPPEALGAEPAPDEPLDPALAPPDAPVDAPLDGLSSAKVVNGMANAAATAAAINVLTFISNLLWVDWDV
jgi:hypothetical protein